MDFRRLFERSESNKRHEAIDDWPMLPDLRLPNLNQLRDLSAMKQVVLDELKPDKYSYSLVIGLGENGRLALQGWLDCLQRDAAGYQRNLRLLLISDNPVKRLASEQVKIRQFDLQDSSTSNNLSSNNWSPSSEGRRQSVRAVIQHRFRALPNFTPFWSYLNTAVRELVSEMGSQTDIRVMLVACLDEGEMGLLGDLLEALHAVRGGNNLRFSNVTLLLGINGSLATLNEAERVATLREIGRFTFSGRHLMSKLPYIEEPIVDGALLDFVFLFEASVPNLLPEAQAESLFTLLHPSSAPIWENLRNDLSQTSNARSETHLAFVNSLGIATLFVPVGEIKQYVSSRLAYAAVFGELNEPEGLLAKGQLTVNYQQRAEKFAQDWLLTGPQRHPIWNWLLSAKGPQHFRQVPNLADVESFRLAFQAQLAHGLMGLLNDKEQVDSLQQAITGLRWLYQKLDQIQTWFQQSNTNNQSEPETQLSYLLESFLATVKVLQQQVAKWERVIGLSSSTSNPTIDVQGTASDATARQSGSRDWRTMTERPFSVASEPDWRSRISKTEQSGDWRSMISTPTSSEVNENSPLEQNGNESLRQILVGQHQTAERLLAAIEDSQVKRPLTYNLDNPLEEVTQYYEDTIRPELSRHGLDASPRFQRVRERVGWWIDLPRNRPPELLLICLPINTHGPSNGIPTSESRFRPDDIERLSQTLLEISLAEAQTVVTDLTGQWMERQLDRPHFRTFLAQAERPMLDYDQVQAMSLSNKYASKSRRYLIGRDRSLTSRFKERAFRNVAAVDVNDVPEAERYLLTALGLRLNIPLSTVNWFNHHFERYNHQEELHLYQPERLAARYENNLPRIRRSRYEFPPELVMSLSDERLVSLFCQALFSGQIKSLKRDTMRGQSVWDLTPPSSLPNWAWEPLALGPEDGSWYGIWQALKQFTLDLPFGFDTRTQPAHPFYAANREKFLEALTKTVREARRDVNGFQEQSKHFETTYLKTWEANLQGNLLGQALFDLLKIELSRPLWRGW